MIADSSSFTWWFWYCRRVREGPIFITYILICFIFFFFLDSFDWMRSHWFDLISLMACKLKLSGSFWNNGLLYSYKWRVVITRVVVFLSTIKTILSTPSMIPKIISIWFLSSYKLLPSTHGTLLTRDFHFLELNFHKLGNHTIRKHGNNWYQHRIVNFTLKC